VWLKCNSGKLKKIGVVREIKESAIWISTDFGKKLKNI
jgi:hypothetical protein